MSPRYLIPMTVALALAGGAVTAVALDDNDDNGPRTIAITGTARTAPTDVRVDVRGARLSDAQAIRDLAYGTDSSLDTLLEKGRKLTFRLDSRSTSGDNAVLLGRVARSRSGEITGRIDARP